MYLSLSCNAPLQQVELARWCGCKRPAIAAWRSAEEPRNADWFLRIDCACQALQLGLSAADWDRLDLRMRQARQAARFGASGPKPEPPPDWRGEASENAARYSGVLRLRDSLHPRGG